MMILCTTCLHAVPNDLERCPFCSEEFDERGEIDERIEWKIIRTVSTEIEARLIAGRLRAYGIPAFVLSQVDSTRNFTVGALAVAKIFVPESLAGEAESILATPAEDPADALDAMDDAPEEYPEGEHSDGEHPSGEHPHKDNTSDERNA